MRIKKIFPGMDQQNLYVFMSMDRMAFSKGGEVLLGELIGSLDNYV